jgi:hypothetical protein
MSVEAMTVVVLVLALLVMVGELLAKYVLCF